MPGSRKPRRRRQERPAEININPLSYMIRVHVHVRVKPECRDAFVRATMENAGQSRLEPGVAEFEAYQQADDPDQFLLVEVYRDSAAVGHHKETAHYRQWRDTVAPMMAEPRRSVKYTPAAAQPGPEG